MAFEIFNNMVLEPLLYGESAGVSGIGLLVALAFWTWLWGPIGLVLAIPLTVCVVVLSKYVPQMDFIGVLMRDEPAMESNVSYYQRLLAMDQAEAAEIVEEHLKTHPEEQLFDGVLIPALSYARRDRDLGCLTEDGELALHMFRRLLDSTRYEVEVMSEAILTSEVIALVGEKSPAMIVVATVSPGGLAQTRYLCKRLRARFPTLRIAVGRWGMGSEDSNSIMLAGADRVGTAMIETRQQMIQLCPINAYSEGQSVTTVPTYPPSQKDVFRDVVG